MDLSSLTVDKLKRYCVENNIKITRPDGRAKLKSDLIASITRKLGKSTLVGGKRRSRKRTSRKRSSKKAASRKRRSRRSKRSKVSRSKRKSRRCPKTGSKTCKCSRRKKSSRKQRSKRGGGQYGGMTPGDGGMTPGDGDEGGAEAAPPAAEAAAAAPAPLINSVNSITGYDLDELNKTHLDNIVNSIGLDDEKFNEIISSLVNITKLPMGEALNKLVKRMIKSGLSKLILQNSVLPRISATNVDQVVEKVGESWQKTFKEGLATALNANNNRIGQINGTIEMINDTHVGPVITYANEQYSIKVKTQQKKVEEGYRKLEANHSVLVEAAVKEATDEAATAAATAAAAVKEATDEAATAAERERESERDQAAAVENAFNQIPDFGGGGSKSYKQPTNDLLIIKELINIFKPHVRFVGKIVRH